ncbi:MAG TPA: DUF488 domain-containing protein [Steroidobacteraceae bacterium]|nr:DUF488 domain-containing protein [Steroidobacteraceae bacterium]
MATQPVLYTIGHSNHSARDFLALLERHGVTAIADVRSVPQSRFNPQFGRQALERTLQERGIAYLFLGEELGARSADPECYRDEKVQYDRLARSAPFRRGLEALGEALGRQRLSLMCAEREPLECHRAILIAPQMSGRGIPVGHILADGSLETHEQTIERLIRQLELAEDLFKTRQELSAQALRIQGERIAYTRPADHRKRSSS